MALPFSESVKKQKNVHPITHYSAYLPKKVHEPFPTFLKTKKQIANSKKSFHASNKAISFSWHEIKKDR